MAIAVIYGGTRKNGNTELLTKQVIQGLEVEEIYLSDYLIKPIKDMRHSNEGFQDVNDDYNSVINRVLRYDIIIFATPIYWYSMTGIMKNFIDRWSQTSRDPKYPNFKKQMQAKKGYVIAVGGDEPLIKGLPMIQQFQYIFHFMGMHFDGYILGKGYKPGDIFTDRQAICSANLLKEKIR